MFLELLGLIEAGARYVEVTSEYIPFVYWDTHENGHVRAADMKRSVDRPVAKLIRDLEERGLLDRTVVNLDLGKVGMETNTLEQWRQLIHRRVPRQPLARALLSVSPLIAFLIWKFSYLGLAFDYIEANFFGRGFLELGYAFYAWSDAFRTLLRADNLQHTAYYLTEFLGLAIAVVACIVTLKSHPEIGWFSLAVVLISWGSGPAQGIHRYILGAPAVFVALARWGGNPVFDRVWTVLSILLMGMLATLFAFDMWVA